jgi:cytoskeletal protein CcmA (bactofilin family)
VKLLSSAYVEGDITHEQLSIDVGAYFQGRCLQTRSLETPHVSSAPVASHTPTMNSYDMSSLSDLK